MVAFLSRQVKPSGCREDFLRLTIWLNTELVLELTVSEQTALPLKNKLSDLIFEKRGAISWGLQETLIICA